ncbi:MAG: HlyD family secretion protein [Gemmatimonadota bacterium]
MSSRARIGLISLGLLAVAATLRLTVFAGGGREGPVLASGTVEATDADLGFQVAGRVEDVAVREGDRVEGGQRLASLDRSELEARRRAGAARVAAARARLDELRHGSRTEEIAAGRAALRAAEERRTRSRLDLDRARRLHEGGAVSQETLDHARTAFEVAEAAVDEAAERLRILETGPRAERIRAAEAELAQAEAAVHQIEALLDYSIITAPFPGLITVRHREPGESVAPGAPVLTLMNPDDRWIRIYVREDEAGRVAIGQAARITSDAYDDRTYGGEVSFIASQAEFTPRNVQTTEERVKLVYEVRVRISDDPDFDLKPGLAADVSLEPAGS